MWCEAAAPQINKTDPQYDAAAAHAQMNSGWDLLFYRPGLAGALMCDENWNVTFDVM